MLFEEIYENYFKDVFRLCLSLTKNEENAEDLAQETFVKALLILTAANTTSVLTRRHTADLSGRCTTIMRTLCGSVKKARSQSFAQTTVR